MPLRVGVAQSAKQQIPAALGMTNVQFEESNLQTQDANEFFLQALQFQLSRVFFFRPVV